MQAAAFVATLFSFSLSVEAHEHHMDKIEEGHAISDDPIDSILWIHILIQSLAWGILFPTGMVLGIIRSKWHVPVQSTGTALAIIGYFLGHKHKGRQFAPNIHSKFVPIIMLWLIVQVAMGIYLKLHLERGIHGKIRKIVVLAHGIVGKLMPIVIWVQFLFGGITAMGFCRGDHIGQCLAHFIMGSAFIAYGVLLTILLLVGQLWLRRTGRSQEFFDSLVIAAWGCVNTFTEHRWGGPWVHNDLQHTTMGIVWWCAGLLGIWLSRKRDGRPKRNLIPAIVILLTGYAMSAHPQHLPLSTMIHTIFGYTLMAAGLTRIIEISFVLKDRNSTTEDGSDPSSFQYLTPFLLYASGFLFMGATEEQMQLLSDANVTHVSYVLILYSIAFLLFLFVNMLLHLYAVHAWSSTSKADPEAPLTNGSVPNGHARADRRIRDAEEFELEGLISEDEDAEPIGSNERKHLVEQ
ncbi:integral membrane protein-like protein [Lojkania enalia]|uniref:Integral membrane protein-like protein n=1 Tax=Lojkania enalia TaxID=147567 RepID=A0A9P4K6R8_9PLEO|nr:integral membrane protein-like protein [Didymosphaeria enalia]